VGLNYRTAREITLPCDPHDLIDAIDRMVSEVMRVNDVMAPPLKLQLHAARVYVLFNLDKNVKKR